MLKIITKSVTFSAITLGLMTVANQVTLAAAKCTLNGREVPCEELGKQVKRFLGWGIGGFLVITALGIGATVFWIMMIIHAAKHNIKDRAMWIVLMVFTGIVGALIYYFVVKRKFDS